jgi:DNA-binding Xre family transcriptional regulator
MILYDRLWNTLKNQKITQYRLIKYYGISSGQLGRLRKNQYVSTHTIEMLCMILNCQVEDIMEFRPDDSQRPMMEGALQRK